MGKWLLVGGLGLVVVCNLAIGGVDKDQKDIQGAWKVVKVIENGRDEGKDIEKFQMIFKDKGFSIEKEGKEFLRGTFKLDSSRKPKEIDFKIEKSPEQDQVGKTATGIYKFDGEMLIWCATKPGDGNRPTDFTSEAGSGRMLITLKKIK